jgi:hypothetical protein
MKQGRTLIELAQELDRQNAAKKDFIAPGAAMHVEKTLPEQEPLLVMNNGKSFGMRETFHNQLAETLEIPKQYYRRIADVPELYTRNVNYWLQKEPKRLVRTLDGQARAFLSDRYRPLDHYDLAQAVLPKIQETDCRIESCDVTERRLYIKAVSNRITAEVKVGDVVQAGIIVSNSEIGEGSLRVEPLIFRLVCLNGAIVNDMAMRRHHVGRNGYGEIETAMEFYRDETKQADDRAFWMKVQDTVSAVLHQTRFAQIIKRMQAAAENGLPAAKVEAVVEEITKRFSFVQAEKENVLAHLISGGDLSQYGLLNAVTRTAQDVESYDRATELERAGGAILELPRNDWDRMTK